MLVLISCKDEDKNQENEVDSETEQNENYNISETSTKESNSERTYSDKEDESIDSPDRESNNKTQSSEVIASGTTYVKTDENDANCSCYCIELDMNNNTELCLSENKMYINARYAKSGDLVNMYYINPSNKNTNKDLPWEDFDTNTPIAVLSPGENGNMDLDWKGFSINGQLAVDYAIYGKKTLEGTYKKK